jgi:putative DNA primase/helicase
MSATTATAATGSFWPEDLQMWNRLCVPLELVAEYRIHRATDSEIRARHGVTWEPAKDVGGIVFPYFHPATGYLVYVRVRRDKPELDEDCKPKNKYICPPQINPHLYFPPNPKAKLADSEMAVALMEAEKSVVVVDAWTKRTGKKILPVAMGGCWNWHGKRARSWLSPNGSYERVPGPIDDLNYCNNHTVYILLDANAATNPDVQRARTELIVELSKPERNCTVLVCDLPQLEGVNGPDDLVALYEDSALERVFADAYSPADKSVNRPASLTADESTEWPEPEDLGSELPPVPAFDPRLLPDALRPMVEDVADRMQVPIDFPAVAAVAALAGVTGRRCLMQPKERDSSWVVVPNLWGGIIAPPGAMKSPVISCVMSPARAIEADWRREYEEAVREYESKQELAELDRAVWKENYKRAAKDGTGKPKEPKSELIEPSQSRLIAVDATFEALHKIMSANPAGVFVLRDELSGWLAALEKEGRECERAFALEGWNGDSSFTVDRIVRGSVHVPHCCMSLFGGIQPARLRAYLADALRDGPANDGLIQRFQLIVYPDQGGWEYRDRSPNVAALDRADSVFRRIAALNPESPLRFRFSSEAQALFCEWSNELEPRLRSGELDPAMVAHLAKYRKLMPALSLLLSHADGATATADLAHTQRAADWCGYLEKHACRLYASRISPERLAAIALAKRLKNGWKHDQGSFTLRDVYQNDWSGLATPEEAEAALRLLEDAGWVRRVVMKSGTGRPSVRFTINPRVGGSCVRD